MILILDRSKYIFDTYTDDKEVHYISFDSEDDRYIIVTEDYYNEQIELYNTEGYEGDKEIFMITLGGTKSSYYSKEQIKDPELKFNPAYTYVLGVEGNIDLTIPYEI